MQATPPWLQELLTSCLTCTAPYKIYAESALTAADARDAPPEEAARPGHLAKRQVELGGHIEVSNAHETRLWVQVRDRLVHRRVERRDHCGKMKVQSQVHTEKCRGEAMGQAASQHSRRPAMAGGRTVSAVKRLQVPT